MNKHNAELRRTAQGAKSPAENIDMPKFWLLGANMIKYRNCQQFVPPFFYITRIMFLCPIVWLLVHKTRFYRQLPPKALKRWKSKLKKIEKTSWYSPQDHMFKKLRSWLVNRQTIPEKWPEISEKGQKTCENQHFEKRKIMFSSFSPQG